MKFTQTEYAMIITGLCHWKTNIELKNPDYHKIELFEQKLHINKKELVE